MSRSLGSLLSLTILVLTSLVLTSLVPDGCQAEVPVNGLTEAEQRGGWSLLFDGQSTSGWRNYRKPDLNAGWQVRDGALERVANGAGDLVTTREYKYFELSLEYRIAKGGNSGIMFHVAETEPAPWMTGPEIQIQDNIDGHDPQKAGWLYQLYQPVKPAWAIRFEEQVGLKSPEIADATLPPGEWNHVYLRISPTQSEVAVNGVSYYYFQLGNGDWNRRVAKSKFAEFKNFGKTGQGLICLQDHGDSVAFRNIKIRELDEAGNVDDPVDGSLPVKTEVAFPDLEWEGYEPVNEAGKVQRIRPMIITHAADGSNRLFVATQSGTIHVLPNAAETKQTQLFLDISEKVADWQKENEEGLLGFAFHPNYSKTGEFFVYYSSSTEPHVSIVSRFHVSKDNPNQADADSEELVIRIPQPFANHNGGSIAFGPDGCLYIGLGDGGGRNDPLGHGQNLETWMGSILRIDVDRRDGSLGYAIPHDNPFIARLHARPEIFAYGLRNVWRLSFDRQTGDLWAADVGQDLWEEINIVKPGGNYGWSIREASYGFGNAGTDPRDPVIDPVWEYDHQVGKSVTGGFVYRGSRIPELQGCYVYADFVTGKLWALKYDQQANKVVFNKSIQSDRMPVLAFGEDEQGEIYVAIESAEGRFYRLVPE